MEKNKRHFLKTLLCGQDVTFAKSQEQWHGSCFTIFSDILFYLNNN